MGKEIGLPLAPVTVFVKQSNNTGPSPPVLWAVTLPSSLGTLVAQIALTATLEVWGVTVECWGTGPSMREKPRGMVLIRSTHAPEDGGMKAKSGAA